MSTLKRVESWLAGAERFLLVLILGVILGLSFAQVVLRTLFSSGILWGDTLGRHLVLWIGFLGAGLAAANDKQFAMDASARLFSGRLKAGVQFILHGFTAAICGLLANAAMAFFRQELADAKALVTIVRVAVPAWAIEAIIPAGFVLLMAHYVLKAAESAIALAHGEIARDKEGA